MLATLKATQKKAVTVTVINAIDSILHINHLKLGSDHYDIYSTIAYLVESLKRLSADVLVFKYLLNL